MMFEGLKVTCKEVNKDHYIIVLIKGDQEFNAVVERSQLRFIIGVLDNEIN